MQGCIPHRPCGSAVGVCGIEIARSKFKEEEGASERPYAIKYLSVLCDISPLILCSPSEAQT